MEQKEFLTDHARYTICWSISCHSSFPSPQILPSFKFRSTRLCTGLFKHSSHLFCLTKCFYMLFIHLQSRIAWMVDSTTISHIGQQGFRLSFLLAFSSYVNSLPCLTNQSRICHRPGPCVFHIFFQLAYSSNSFSNQVSSYAEPVVNTPFGSSFQ